VVVRAMAYCTADLADVEHFSRDEIKDYLLGLAERHTENRQAYQRVRKDPAKQLECWWTKEEGTAMTVLTMRADGLSIDDFRAFYHAEAFPSNTSDLDPMVSSRALSKSIGDGVYLMYQHIQTPRFVANRCAIAAVYNIDSRDSDGFVHLATSKGNKAIEEASSTLIGKDVLSHIIASYNKFEPCADGSGIMITSVACIDAAGDLPSFVKNQIATANSQVPENLVKLLLKRKKRQDKETMKRYDDEARAMLGGC